MANENSLENSDATRDNTFDTLEKNNVLIPLHIKNILSRLGYFGLRAFSTINDHDITEIELGVTEILAEDAAEMTMKEKTDLFGRMYANKPKKFKLLPGDKAVIKVISEVSKKLVESMPPINMDRSIQTPKQAIQPQKAVNCLTKDAGLRSPVQNNPSYQPNISNIALEGERISEETTLADVTTPEPCNLFPDVRFQIISKTPSKSDDQQPSLTYIIAFPPFKIGKNMKLAPAVRTEFDAPRKAYLDQILQQSDSEPIIGLNPRQYRGNRGKTCGATWPLGNYNDAGEIDEDEARAHINNDDIVSTIHRRMRPKLLQFCENHRPAYWGTWTKHCHSVGPRRPFGKETVFDYDVDSDDEVEPADESSTDSEGEGEKNEPADHYEVDDVFVVPDGYLSGDDPNCEQRKPKTSAAEEPFRVMEIEPTFNLRPNSFELLQRYAGVWCLFCDAFPIKTVSSELNCENGESSMADHAVVLSTPKKLIPSELNCENGESSMADGVTRSGNKSSKRPVSDRDVPALIRLLHGTSRSKFKIAEDFLLHLEPNRAEESKNGPSQSQIFSKINEIASWSKCTDAGAVNGRWCWLVQSDVLACYGLAGLSANLNFTEMKQRGSRKTDDSRSEEDTPLAKIPRVSLLKRF